MWEGSLLPTLPPAFIACQRLDSGHCEPREERLIAGLICMSLIFSDVDIFSWDSFKGCELNLPLEIGHLIACLVLNFFSVTPRTFLEASVLPSAP